MFALKHLRKFGILANRYYFISANRYHNHKFSHVTSLFKLNNTNINLLKSVCTTKVNYEVTNNTIKMSEAFLNLDTSYKQQQKINRKEIESLIKYIEDEDIIHEDNYLLLLQCCGNLIPDELPSSRINLLQQVWKTISQKIHLTVDHYNVLLQCYIENKMTLSHKEFLSSMICSPNVQTYNLLLECVCENGDLKQAVEIMNTMKEKGFAANEPVFSSLILCHLRNKHFESVENILSTMRIAHITRSSSTYTALLRGYAETGENHLFKTTLSSAPNRHFNQKQIISILHSVCVSNNLDLLPLIRKAWAETVDSRTFEIKLNNLCVQLIYLKKPLVAYELFKTFIEPEIGFLSESDSYGSFLIYELIKSETPYETIINILDDLINTNRNIYAFFKATELSLKITNVDLSLKLLQALFERKVALKNHYFWPILVHEAQLYGEKGVFKIFTEMLKFNVKIESETLEVYSLQYIKNLDPEIVINKLKQFNLTVTEVLTPISIVLLREGKIKQVVDLTTKYKVKLDGNKLIKQLASTYVSTNDIQNMITILQNIQQKNKTEDWAGQLIIFIFTRSGFNINYHQIYNLLKKYKEQNIKMSAQSMDRIDYLNKTVLNNNLKPQIQKILRSLDCINGSDYNSHIPHPRNMTLEELECHLLELKDKQMETRGVLRKLIQMHCRLGNVKRVPELINEFNEAGYNISPGMKSSLLDLFLKNEQFEEAWNIYKDIKENFPDFCVDEFKIIDLAKLLIDNNKFNEAVVLLQNECSNRKILGGITIEKNCWKLLDTVANTGNVQHTKTIFKILIENGFCTETNIILGPLIRVHINNNNKIEATEEYVNCCLKYNKTPLLHEFLCYLVKNESSSELIQKVIESTVLVHGAGKTHTTFAAALAENNLNKTLRKLFLESNLCLMQNYLEKYCERWIKEGKIHALKNFISAGQGINFVDLSVVYFNLMRFYSSNNDYKNALLLWNEIQDKNVFHFDKIKTMIDDLIRTQKNSTENKKSITNKTV